MSYFEDNASITYNISNSENFRAWAKMVHKCLEEIGVVNTTDTGQINLSTVETPVANTTNAGYEIWRFNDEQQTEHPVFLKIQYGRAAEATRARLVVQFGTGTNGAGTLTNPGTEQILTNAGTPGEKGMMQGTFKEGEMFFTMSFLTTSATVHQGFWFCRLKHPITKAYTGMFAYGAAATAAAMVTTGQVWNTSAWANHVLQVTSPGSLFNGVIIPGIFYVLGPTNSAPFSAFCLVSSTTIGVGEEGEVEIGGKTRKYKTTITALGGPERSTGSGTAVPTRFAILKE